MSEVPDAPYMFVWDTVIIDKQKVKVYWLGKFGKEKVEDAVSKTIFNSEITKLRLKINTLINVIGGSDRLIQYFKDDFLRKLQSSAYHHGELVDEPFWYEKDEALRQLFVEGKIIRSHGWIKLKKEEKKK